MEHRKMKCIGEEHNSTPGMEIDAEVNGTEFDEKKGRNGIALH